MCQDTGTNIYFISLPVGVSQKKLKEHIKEATQRATELGYLRPNTVDSLSGKTHEDNWGEHQPCFFFKESEEDEIKISLILKGGGCENVGKQYALPYTFGSGERADRNLTGVKKCVVDAVNEAQGRGCSPGVVSVAFGGDRLTSYIASKEAFLRKVGERHSISYLG